ncbi:MAG: aminotransferase class IV, partial [Balneolaceae bacterium]
MQVYLNGGYLEQESAKISVSDRGFIFGDGIYEVIRVVDNRFFREEEHLRRMDEGLHALGINLDSSQRSAIGEISRELISRNGLQKGEATIYLQIT